jgi:hypothetical protein
VLGILSLILCGLFTGIPAMITARRATRDIDESGGRLGGRGIAQAGFVTGLIGTLLTTVGILIVLITFAVGGVVKNTFDNTCDTISADPAANTDCY